MREETTKKGSDLESGAKKKSNSKFKHLIKNQKDTILLKFHNTPVKKIIVLRCKKRARTKATMNE